tara:strand:- start:2005 stop:2835 length:831 start_codon:yes stop_codon:yes gene_type:complete
MTIKQLGGVFGRNPTFNDVTIEGQLTFEGNIDIDSDLKVDGDLDVTGTAIVENLGVNVASVTSGYRVDVYELNNNGMNIQAGDAGSDKVLSLGSPSTADKVVFTAGGDIDMTVGGGDIIFKSGSGIDFSATAGTGTSELLSDYEEGVWTPTLVGAVSAGSYSVAIEDSSCKYTKVGRQVTVTGKFTFTVSSAGSGYAKIGGLPFATSATNAMTGTVRTKNIGLAAGTVSLCILNSTSGSATYFSIAQSIDNAASVFLDIAGISSTDQITMTLTYFT